MGSNGGELLSKKAVRADAASGNGPKMQMLHFDVIGDALSS